MTRLDLPIRLLIPTVLALALAGCQESGSSAGPVPTAEDVTQALAASDPLERAESLARIFQRLPSEELAAVKVAYEDAFLDIGDLEIVLLAEWWGRFDGPGAVKWSFQQFTTSAKPVQQAVIRAWAREDPAAALRYVEGQSNESVRGLWLDAVITGWDESDSPGVLDFIRTMAPGRDRQRALAAVTRRMVLRDGVDATFDWAEGLPEDTDKFKLNAIRRAGSAAAAVDPVRASERATPLADGPYADGLLRRVGIRWAKQPGGGEPAMRWLATLPTGAALDDAADETWRAWLAIEREAALRFFEGERANDPKLNHALALYTEVIVREQPDRALKLAESIADPEFRWATVGRAWRRWWVAERDAAEAWWSENEARVPDLYRKKIPQIPPPMRRAQERFEQEKSAQATGAPS